LRGDEQVQNHISSQHGHHRVETDRRTARLPWRWFVKLAPAQNKFRDDTGRLI